MTVKEAAVDEDYLPPAWKDQIRSARKVVKV